MNPGDARKLVTTRLADAGAAVFAPVSGGGGVDFAVRAGGDGQYVELVVRGAASAEKPRAFAMRRFRPRPHLIIVGVADGEDGPEAWLLPSAAFERFAAGAPGEPEWTLDLDEDDGGAPLADRLAVYRERWALVSDFPKYRSTLGDPVALQVLIAMG